MMVTVPWHIVSLLSFSVGLSWDVGCWMFNAEWTFGSASSVWGDLSVRVLELLLCS
jgi:hypothetical protein